MPTKGKRSAQVRMLSAGPGRPPHTDLARYIASLPAPSKMLGLTHVTSSYTLRDVIGTGAISSVEECKVIHEKVTYAFYGRASFRGRDDTEPTDLVANFPSVLIIDPKSAPVPKYVFGFDSGAFMSGLMDQYLSPYMPLFDFLLAPTIDSAARIVEAVFENADNYFSNRPTQSLHAPDSNFEATSYVKLVNSGGRGSNRLDERASTPELIFSNPIDLRSCIRAAILPDTLSADAQIGGTLRSLGIKVYDYPFVSCSRPGENYSLIRRMVRLSYEELGWL